MKLTDIIKRKQHHYVTEINKTKQVASTGRTIVHSYSDKGEHNVPACQMLAFLHIEITERTYVPTAVI